MTNRLLAAADAALDGIAAATDYAHPLVDLDAVAWLEADFEKKHADDEHYPTNYVREMAELLPVTPSCDRNHNDPAAAACGWAYGDDAAPNDCLAGFRPRERGYASVRLVALVVGTTDPQIPSHRALAAAMKYAAAHHLAAEIAAAQHRRRRRSRGPGSVGGMVRYAWLGTASPAVPF